MITISLENVIVYCTLDQYLGLGDVISIFSIVSLVLYKYLEILFQQIPRTRLLPAYEFFLCLGEPIHISIRFVVKTTVGQGKTKLFYYDHIISEYQAA